MVRTSHREKESTARTAEETLFPHGNCEYEVCNTTLGKIYRGCHTSLSAKQVFLVTDWVFNDMARHCIDYSGVKKEHVTTKHFSLKKLIIPSRILISRPLVLTKEQ